MDEKIQDIVFQNSEIGRVCLRTAPLAYQLIYTPSGSFEIWDTFGAGGACLAGPSHQGPSKIEVNGSILFERLPE